MYFRSDVSLSLSTTTYSLLSVCAVIKRPGPDVIHKTENHAPLKSTNRPSRNTRLFRQRCPTSLSRVYPLERPRSEGETEGGREGGRERGGGDERLLVLHGRLVEADDRELGSEGLDVGAQLAQRGPLALLERRLEVCELPADAVGAVDLLCDAHAAVDELGDGGEVLLRESARGERGRADADAARDEGGLVARHGVLVECNVGELEHGLDARAVDAGRLEVDEQQVVVRAARDERVAAFAHRVGEPSRVAEHLLLVLDELWRGRLLERGGEGGDGVVVRPALVAREDGLVDGALELVRDLLPLLVDPLDALPVKDHRASRSAEGLVRGGGDDVRVVEGGRHNLCCDEAGDVRHVCEQDRPDLVADLAHPRVVDVARVRRRAGDDELGPEDGGRLLQLVVVDDPSRLVEAVRHRGEVARDHRDGAASLGLEAVRQVAAVREVEAHQPVVRLQQGGEDGEVGRRARVRLHVDAPRVGRHPKRLQRTRAA
mmetsp:Transcript_24738/g.80923  ORF Transcript_24738/g.80923 Transcript_24738/m.80923 type:complete len:488 (+) Transcript_24738:17-1480(+)